MTKELQKEFKKLNCITLYIPSGYTRFIQILDISLNKTLIALIAQAAENYSDKYSEKYKIKGFTIGD